MAATKSSSSSSSRSSKSRSAGTKSRSSSRASTSASSSSARGKSSQTTTDHDQIRRWAEERGARPACVRGTGGKRDTGMIRLDFPGYSGADSLAEISWDDWFEAFDQNNLALVCQDKTSGGRKSNFNKLVSRDENTSGGGRSSTSRTGARGRATTRTKKNARGGASSAGNNHGRGAK